MTDVNKDVNKNVNKLHATKRTRAVKHPAQRKDEKAHHTIKGKEKETTTSGGGKRK